TPASGFQLSPLIMGAVLVTSRQKFRQPVSPLSRSRSCASAAGGRALTRPPDRRRGRQSRRDPCVLSRERAFRYCPHHAGHAIAAVRYAAAALGWSARLLDHLGDDEVATWLGIDRAADYAAVAPDDREHVDALLLVGPGLPAFCAFDVRPGEVLDGGT